ncbi:EamA family transporter [Flavitalea antarctica]
MWWIFALLSAFFAALTAVFAKIGIRNVNSDLATAIRTLVILLLAWGIAIFGSNTMKLSELTKHNWIFRILSGAATGLSWIFLPASNNIFENSIYKPILNRNLFSIYRLDLSFF